MVQKWYLMVANVSPEHYKQAADSTKLEYSYQYGGLAKTS